MTDNNVLRFEDPDGESFKAFSERNGLDPRTAEAVTQYTGALALFWEERHDPDRSPLVDEPVGGING